MVGVAALFITALLASISSASTETRKQEARVISSCTTPNTVALTFDDGPSIYLQKIVDTLDAAGATGTFFFNGNNHACIYDEDSVQRVLYAVQHGHLVGSHTWSHANLTTLTWDQINNEMGLVEQALQKIAGVSPAFIRPPYGSYNDLVLKAAYLRHQSIVLWDLDPTGSTPAQIESAYDARIVQRPSTIIAVGHETDKTTAEEVLPYAIRKLQAAGYHLVSLAECVGFKPYHHSVQAPGVRDSTWTCSK